MKLIIFSGLPSTGKSTLPEAIGKMLGIPVFARDWLEAALLRSELKPADESRSLGSAGFELLTVLAERQFILGQSLIPDSVAGSRAIRSKWFQLAQQYHTEYRIIECICSDEALHRDRLRGRERHLPGWYELEWSDVERARRYYTDREGERLLLDMTHPFTDSLLKAKTYCE